MTLLERWLSKVDRRNWNDCWPWIGAVDKYGYGRMFVGDVLGLKRWDKAHRVGYHLNIRALQEREEVRHRCDNPPCCNPRHWLAGSHAQNMNDMKDRSRARCAKKTTCPRGHSYDMVAKGRRCCRICRREQWRRSTAKRRAAKKLWLTLSAP